jgi:hypothetical protein
MAKGVYTASIRVTGLTSARTLMYLTAPSTAVVELLNIHVTNESNATNQQLSIRIHKVTALGSPTATTLTPAKHENGSAAASSTVKGNVTASEPAYDGESLNIYGAMGVPSLIGYHFEPISQEERVYVAPSATYGLRLFRPTGPTSFNAAITMTFKEIG